MIEWQTIPDAPENGSPEAAHASAPFDGNPVLLFVDIATTDVVRVGWWRGGDEPFCSPEDRGWWSYANSVSQDQLEGVYAPTHWAQYNGPST